jgi:hypothetical protein
VSILTRPCYRDPELGVVVDDGAARDAAALGDCSLGAELLALLVSWRLLLMPGMLHAAEQARGERPRA